MIQFQNKEYRCSMEVTLELIGGKWKALILWHLDNNRIMRYSELKRLHPKLTQKMLTQQLRELERDGLINRKVYAQVPPKVEYSLTPWGEKLKPVLSAMCQWGNQYLKGQGLHKEPPQE
ncbi:winged helix-turn-helix transcriptional regulator [Desulforamulus ruminis]|uniref:Helix-turn-helix HxlR type n=1 Tax=Desulforamulus ruminis (strain ATCC 23193 / DSM 2154 / NCIMB 8452 / DL) TaxID=696281 RepID=F6DRY7_DESRL|nr:helix-turn-helix domain-containing protein [Desulforamulus ruminis]AEG61011.1 helix-turn-helix HxlR type [Desulforamulus ruminis DSM 2154]